MLSKKSLIIELIEQSWQDFRNPDPLLTGVILRTQEAFRTWLRLQHSQLLTAAPQSTRLLFCSFVNTSPCPFEKI